MPYYETIEEDLKRAKEILAKGAQNPEATNSQRSKWCVDGKDAESHGWCANRDASETHCGCPCHQLSPRNHTILVAWLAGETLGGGTIYGSDTYAAYKLLESFVEVIETITPGVCRLVMLAIEHGGSRQAHDDQSRDK